MIQIQNIKENTTCAHDRQSGKKLVVLTSECFKSMTVQTSGLESGVLTIFLEQLKQTGQGIASLKFYGFDEYQILSAKIIHSTLSVALGTRHIKR